MDHWDTTLIIAAILSVDIMVTGVLWYIIDVRNDLREIAQTLARISERMGDTGRAADNDLAGPDDMT